MVQREVTCQNHNTILITFFSIKGANHFYLIPQGQSVNQAYYVKILKQLCEAEMKHPPYPLVWLWM